MLAPASPEAKLPGAADVQQWFGKRTGLSDVVHLLPLTNAGNWLHICKGRGQRPV